MKQVQVTFNTDKGFWLFSDGKENTRVEDTPRDMYNALQHFHARGYEIDFKE